MSKPKNAMEIFKLLEKSNCRECGEKTCLAFASAVYQSRKQINRCPRLDTKIIEKYKSDNSDKEDMSQQMGGQLVDELKKSLTQMDFEKAAQRAGAVFDGKSMTLKMMGRNIKILPDGTFNTDIHAKSWIKGPVLDYVINGKGSACSTCQERLVWKRCEKPGPGIFETPFGRVGGAICFDSFSKETFKGFKQSGVDIVIIVALWGTILPILKHPDSIYFHKLLRYQSYLASEIVPRKYVEELKIPAVYVNQSGVINLPISHPRFYPSPNWSNSEYQFVGNSNVIDKTGKKILNGFDLKQDFCAVAEIEANAY